MSIIHPKGLLQLTSIVTYLFLLFSPHTWATIPSIKAIEGHYRCNNVTHGFDRQLHIMLDLDAPSLNDRFFVFQLLFSGDSKRITGQSKGYMLYDANTHIAVDYVKNQQNKKIKGPGLMYFQFPSATDVRFNTYFFEPSLNKVGEYHCEKSS